MNSASMALPIDVRLMNVTTAILVAAVILACVAAGLWVAMRSPVFAIRQITVTGDTLHNNAVSLRAATGHRLVGNFFTIDIDAAREAFQSVPWVRRAVVQRRFPDRLDVRLEEHVPEAWWGDGRSRMVDRHGAVFETGGDDDGIVMPVLTGPEGHSAQMLELLQGLGEPMRALGVPVARLELQKRGHWRARLQQGAVIDLGRGEPDVLLARAERFARTAAEVAARFDRSAADIESADLRHVGGYAIRVRGVSTVDPSARAAGTD